MRNFLALYRDLDLIKKIGVWGAFASIVGVIVMFDPLGKQDSTESLIPQESGAPIEGNSSVDIEQTGQGDNSPNINNSGSGGVHVEINQSSYREATILDNDGAPVLVLKSFPMDDNFVKHSLRPDNQLGLAEVGTEVKVIEERRTTVPMMNATKVEILSGKYKDEVGWISSSAVRRSKVPA